MVSCWAAGRTQTLRAWHRKLIAKKYDSSGKRRKVGRPPTKDEIRDLVIRMTEENGSWGYTRIRGALANPGHETGRGTIAEILKQAGLEPAPERERRGTWAEFLKTHWEVLGAADFFTVELWKWGGLVRYLIHDRSTLFTKEFLLILESGGVKSVRLPARSPNLNAFA